MIRGAVLGSPISHSLSPVLHQAAFDFLGIEGSYSAIDVPSGQLAAFIDSRGAEFDYLSLTMPLKEEALTLEAQVETEVKRIASGNTLIRNQESWKLLSTDGSGFIKALSNAGITSYESVLIIGAGGTARAVAGSLDGMAKNLHVLARSQTREAALSSAITHSTFTFIPWTTDLDFGSYDLVVNTTPKGAADSLAPSVGTNIATTIFDVIYSPWPTKLAQRWMDCGGNVISGLELLMYQGIDQMALALDKQLDVQSLATHIRPLLQKAIR